MVKQYVPNKPFVRSYCPYKTVLFTLRCRGPDKFALQRSRKHALSVFEVSNCRVSQSIVFQLGNTKYVGSKSSARADPPRKRKIRHSFSLLFSLVASFLFFPFFLCSFLFLASDVVDLVPIWYVALYLAINLCKSSTRCNTSFSTPDLI